MGGNGMGGTITVKGTGKITAPADVTFVTAVINGKCEEFGKAVGELARSTGILRDAIADAGIDRKLVKTSSMNIRQSYRTVYDDEGDRHGRQVPDGFSYSQTVSFEFPNDNAKLSKAVSNITETPVSPNLSFGFGCSDTEKYRNEAIALATANARRQAEIIAKNSGVKLGALKEAVYNDSIGYDEDCMLMNVRQPLLKSSCKEEFDVEAEDLIIIESVTTVWYVG